MNENKIITKSDYIAGLKCKLHLWYKKNNPQKIKEIKFEEEYRAKIGRVVEQYAKKLYSNYKNVEFEASYTYNNFYARVDILEKCQDNTYNIYEIKSSTAIKEKHIDDISFQYFVLNESNTKINKCYIIHINKEYELKEELDLKELFLVEDVTNQVIEKREYTKENAYQLLEYIKLKEPNKNDFGCNYYDCKTTMCYENIPKDSLFNLKDFKNKAIDLYKIGIKTFKDVEYNKLTNFQKIQIDTYENSKDYIDKEKISQFINNLKYPIYFLDFEAMDSAIPFIKNTRPYEKIPFQYSIHILYENNELKHKELISNNLEEFTKILINDLESKGSIITYNKVFEKHIINSLKIKYPNHELELEKILIRIEDLMDIFSKPMYYSTLQNGSYSIKNTSKIFNIDSYKGLEIQNGEIAKIKYEEIIRNESNFTKEDITKIKEQLFTYCKQDTYAMVDIFLKLKEII